MEIVVKMKKKIVMLIVFKRLTDNYCNSSQNQNRKSQNRTSQVKKNDPNCSSQLSDIEVSKRRVVLGYIYSKNK